MSDPDWPALFRSMQEQLGMLQAEFIQLKDISASKASLHDTLQLALIARFRHLNSVMQTAVQEALGTRVSAVSAHVAEGLSELQEKKFSSATTCYGRNGKRSSSTGLAFWTTGEIGESGKAEHMWDRATLGQAWFLSPVSWFLGF